MEELGTDISEGNEAVSAPTRPIWMDITLADIAEIDFELPIRGCLSANCFVLSELYRKAIVVESEKNIINNTANNRIYLFLHVITQMCFKPSDKKSPYTAMFVMGDNRTVILEDFIGYVEILSKFLQSTKNIVLKARLADVCWFLDKKRSNCAVTAIDSFLNIAKNVASKSLELSYATAYQSINRQNIGFIERALVIARSIKYDLDKLIDLYQLIEQLFNEAKSINALAPILWCLELELEFNIVEPIEIGKRIEVILEHAPQDESSRLKVALWHLAIRAYRKAKDVGSEHRCVFLCVDEFLIDADKEPRSAMRTSHFIGLAIAQLHSMPRNISRDLRSKLQKRLIDVQSQIAEELVEHKFEIDFQIISQQVQIEIAGKTILEQLRAFVRLSHPRKLNDLKKDAEVLLSETLTSIFSNTYIDRDGKTIGRADSDEDKLNAQIMNLKMYERMNVSLGMIEPALEIIRNEHYFSEKFFYSLLVKSAFISPDQIFLFSRAFSHFFHSDYLSAGYILIPLLENSLRYILKLNNVDVTTELPLDL